MLPIGNILFYNYIIVLSDQCFNESLYGMLIHNELSNEPVNNAKIPAIKILLSILLSSRSLNLGNKTMLGCCEPPIMNAYCKSVEGSYMG